jgi:L-lactate dehydrogenase complex protein LldG
MVTRAGVASPAAEVSEPMSLVELFVDNATRVGFVVHRDGAESASSDYEPSRAAYGLADTGSVVLLASDEPRARSLLPFVHWTYLAESAILPGLDELFDELGNDLPSSVAIITGPSRSGDIEMTLAIGVHGPGEVHIVLVQ